MVSPRPFYVVGHNPNSIPQVLQALTAGANAIEPDINVYQSRPTEFCVGEASPLEPNRGAGDNAPSLDTFLSELHDIALRNPQLALVVFDCKPKAATPELGAALLQKVRTLLTHDTQINVILSVASLTEAAIFQNIQSDLGPREGVMIDQENDPVAVSALFTGDGIVNQSFGNGISVANSVLGPHVRPSMEQACWLRATTGQPRFLYVWTVEDHALMREYLRIGVDGIITGHAADLRAILQEPEFQPLVRYATRADNPFQPANQNYGLSVQTGDVQGAGTDAKVAFTLTGAAGSASITVETNLPGRMERGSLNYVTLPSSDLGVLESIAVQRDNSGLGPDWFLETIAVQGFGGAPVQAIFQSWIPASQPVTRPLARAIGTATD